MGAVWRALMMKEISQFNVCIMLNLNFQVILKP